MNTDNIKLEDLLGKTKLASKAEQINLVAVVGGGPSAVEVAGNVQQLAERSCFKGRANKSGCRGWRWNNGTGNCSDRGRIRN